MNPPILFASAASPFWREGEVYTPLFASVGIIALEEPEKILCTSGVIVKPGAGGGTPCAPTGVPAAPMTLFTAPRTPGRIAEASSLAGSY